MKRNNLIEKLQIITLGIFAVLSFCWMIGLLFDAEKFVLYTAIPWGIIWLFPFILEEFKKDECR